MLTITLLGAFEATWDGAPITQFEADSARALLAYLVMQPGTPFQRDTLADFFWPDQPKSQGLHALRQALTRLRKAIRDRQADPPFLDITRSTLAFNPSSQYWLDVKAFDDRLVANRQHPHRRLSVCPACKRRLQRAAELYRGDFLAGFSLDSYPFQEWMLMQREHLHRQAMDAFYHLAAYYEQRGEFERARDYAWRQIELEPWREEAHRQAMRALASGGQRSAALAQYKTCRQTLAQELGVEPGNETQALYEQIRIGNLQPASPPPDNLPAQLTPFVGRPTEVAHVIERLNHVDCRLLTLVGPGGVGKTRLALHVAQELLPTFRDGVYFVPLSAVCTQETLMLTLAQTLRFDLRPGEAFEEQLGHYLRTKDMLLVLDNFEHLLSSSNLIAQLLRRADDLRILVTSRERLNLQAETLFPVTGLDCPKKDASLASMDSEAVALFVESARRANPSFCVSEANWPWVMRICQLVEGMPLALEMAASGLRTYTCQEIAQSISNNPQFLQSPLQDVPERHRSLEAVFNHSWALLSPEERQVFRRLSVFRGGVQREASRQVAGATPQILTGLVDKSLLQQATYKRTPPQVRYELHNLLHQYAAHKLAQHAQEQFDVHRQHCRYYLGLLARLEVDLQGGGQHDALETVGGELQNIRAAWRWAIAHAKLDEIDRALSSLFLFYDLRHWFIAGERILAEAVEGLDEPEGGKAQRVFYRLLARRGAFLSHMGRYQKGEKQIQCSLRHFETVKDQTEMAFCLIWLAASANRQGQYDLARSHLDQALRLAQSVGALSLKADVWRNLGSVCFYLGEYEQAGDYYQRSLRIRKEIGDRSGEGSDLGNLGLVAYEQDDLPTAQVRFEQALGIIRQELGNREREGWLLNNLGILAADKGHYVDARAHYERALHISQQIGDRWGESNALGNLGLVYWGLGDFDRAAHYHAQAEQIKKEIGDRRGESLIISFQSLLCHYQADHQTALDLGQRALVVAKELGAPNVQGYALTFIAHAYASLGELDQAADTYRQAQAIRQDLGQHNLAWEAKAGLAHTYLLKKDLSRAQEIVDAILEFLKDHKPYGMLEPFRTCWVCIQVLQANQDRRLEPFLAAIRQHLHERAAHIPDDALGRMYLQNSPYRRAIDGS